MKKLLLTLAVLLGFTAMAKADTVTFDFLSDSYGMEPYDGSNNSAYVTTPATISQNGVTIKLETTADKALRMWNDGLRFYKNKDITMTISVDKGSITNIDLTAYKYAALISGFSTTNGTYTASGTTGTWTGEAASIVFSFKTTAGNYGLESIAITTSDAAVVDPDPEPEPDPEPDPTPTTQGTGTEQDPYTCADLAIVGSPNGAAWVKGYIVGYAVGTGNYAFGDAALSVAKTTNIVIADAADVTEASLSVPVQLPSALRAEWSLVDNPSVLFKEVLIYGNLASYFSADGIKNPTIIRFVDATEEPEPDPFDGKVNSVKEIIALSANTEIETTFPLTVGYVNKNNVFVCDSNGDFIQIYNANTLSVGDVIPAGLKATYTLYQGTTPELTNATIPEATAGTFTPIAVSASAIGPDMVNMVILIKNVTFSEDTPSSKTNFEGTADDVTISFRNNYSIEGVASGLYDVAGVVNVYQGAAQVYVTAYTEAEGNIRNADDIASFISNCTESSYPNVAINNPVVALYQNGSNLYIKDDSGYLLVYGNVKKTYTNGMIIPAGITGKAQDYKGVYELSSPVAATFADGEAGEAVLPEYIAYSQLADTDVNTFICINNCTFNQDLEGNWTLVCNDAVVPMYNKFKLTLQEGGSASVTGFVGMNNGEKVIYPTAINISAPVATPTFSVKAGAVAEGTVVALECSDETAAIYYNTDGSAKYYKRYSAPIEITEATTIKAIAIANGSLSLVARASYTIKAGGSGEVNDGDGTFNFADPTTLSPAYGDEGLEADGSTGNFMHKVNDVTFTSGAASVVNSHPEGTGTDARLYKQANGNWSYRFYKNSTTTISVPAGYTIESIEFTAQTATHAGNLAACSFSTGTYADGKWTPSEAGTTEVEITVTGTVGLTYMTVIYSGSEGIADAELSEEAPVEYYNLQGIRVANPENGIYIRRQGNSVSKVLVK